VVKEICGQNGNKVEKMHEEPSSIRHLFRQKHANRPCFGKRHDVSIEPMINQGKPDKNKKDGWHVVSRDKQLSPMGTTYSGPKTGYEGITQEMKNHSLII